MIARLNDGQRFLAGVGVWGLLSLGWLGLGQWLDEPVLGWMAEHRHPWLDVGSVVLTEWLFPLGLLGLVGVMLYQLSHTLEHQSRAQPAVLSFFTAWVVAFVLKSLFATARPMMTLPVGELTNPFLTLNSSGFPSAHTATAMALVLPLWRLNPWLGGGYGVLAGLISLGRVYQLVHSPIDIAGGMVLGLGVGGLFTNGWVSANAGRLWREHLEWRRQLVHCLTGLGVVFFHAQGWLSWGMILGVLLLGVGFSVLLRRGWLPDWHWVVEPFDRVRDDHPGRGAILYAVGVVLAMGLFPTVVAYVAILTLAIGDSVCHLGAVVRPEGRKLPWHPRRTWLGLLIGWGFSVVACVGFVPWWVAVVATGVGVVAESVPWRVGGLYLDDNVVVPLVTGGVCWWLMSGLWS